MISIIFVSNIYFDIIYLKNTKNHFKYLSLQIQILGIFFEALRLLSNIKNVNKRE
jgi:hypothetical protein